MGGKEGKLEEENILRKNSLDCFSPVVAGQGVWGRRWDVCAGGDETGPSVERQKCLQERWRFLMSKWLLVCWLIL